MKYALVLNTMLSPNIENIATVKTSNSRQELVDWYKEQLAPEPWKDGQWSKIFKKDSPLEWFNEGNLEKDNDYWGGIYSFPDEVSDEAIRNFAL